MNERISDEYSGTLTCHVPAVRPRMQKCRPDDIAPEGIGRGGAGVRSTPEATVETLRRSVHHRCQVIIFEAGWLRVHNGFIELVVHTRAFDESGAPTNPPGTAAAITRPIGPYTLARSRCTKPAASRYTRCPPVPTSSWQWIALGTANACRTDATNAPWAQVATERPAPKASGSLSTTVCRKSVLRFLQLQDFPARTIPSANGGDAVY